MQLTGSQNIWFFSALASSILWGFSYVLTEKLMHNGFSPFFVLSLRTMLWLPIIVPAFFLSSRMQADMGILMADWRNIALFVVAALLVFAATFLIFFSIDNNATLSSMVEITYPLFTFLIIWASTGQSQLSLTSGAGAALIFAGIILIYFKG